MPDMTLTCRTCGLDFVFPEELPLFECPACGTSHSRPKAKGAALDTLRRANEERAACDFVNAEQDYRRVLFDHPDEHEALWGVTLCKYGVEYVEDAKTHERKPVIHFLRRKPITEDADFRLACARAPESIRAQYEADADYVRRIQTNVMRSESACDPCEIFLCYKASLPGGDGHTRDFEHARELYFTLSMQGYKVFFAHESLKQAAGANYEAAIFHALHTARVMLVVCTNADYLNTPWVHSEWSRYLERVDNSEDCRLIPLLYDRCDPYTLPAAFITRGLQGLRMGELTSLDSLRQVLNRQLGRAVDVPRPAPAPQPAPVKAEPIKAEPVKAEPVKTGPVKTGLVKAEPVKTGPVKAEPVKTGPVKAEPVKTGPVKAEPVKAEPVKAEPAKAEPAKAEPAKAEPVKTEASSPAKAAPSKRPVWMALLTLVITAVLGLIFNHLCQSNNDLASILAFVAPLLFIFSFVFKRGKVWMTVLSCSMIPGVVAALLMYYVK